MRHDLSHNEKSDLAVIFFNEIMQLKDGQSIIRESEQTRKKPVVWDFDVHYYAKHGWILFWHKPMSSKNIGLLTKDKEQLLRACLNDFSGMSIIDASANML